MSLSSGFSTYRTVSVSSDTLASSVSPTVQYTTNEMPGFSSYRTMSVPVSPTPMSHVQYAVNGGAVDGNAVYGNAVYGNSVYGTVRYLVPVERRVMPESYVVVNRAPQIMANQNLSPVYVQNYGMVSQDAQEVHAEHSPTRSASSAMSHTSSPPKSPEPTPQVQIEVEVEKSINVQHEKSINVQHVNVVRETVTNVSQAPVRSQVPQIEPLAKLDTRFFGELLADIHRKNCDIYTYISEHVSKIRGRKESFDSTDYKVGKGEVEDLIPKGLSELTKQQIRYLLQTRMTADNTMRLLLSTFNNLREELIHLQGDLKRLESEKEELERDLSFKADQAQQYDHLLEAVRENNRQLQVSLKESSSAQRKMETQLLSTRSSDSSRDFRVKELDGRLKALEKENELLRQKLTGQGSSMTLQTKTEELSRQYNQMLTSLREEKDKELQILKTQLLKTQTEYSSSQSSSDRSLQLRITELISTLEQRQIIIKRQEEDIKRLQLEKIESARNVTKTTVTKRYSTQYPILGLLSDDYHYQAPVKEARTVIFESSGPA